MAATATAPPAARNSPSAACCCRRASRPPPTVAPPAELVTIDGLADLGDRPPASSDALRVTIYGRGLDAPPLKVHRSGAGADLDGGTLAVPNAAEPADSDRRAGPDGRGPAKRPLARHLPRAGTPSPGRTQRCRAAGPGRIRRKGFSRSHRGRDPRAGAVRCPARRPDWRSRQRGRGAAGQLGASGSSTRRTVGTHGEEALQYGDDERGRAARRVLLRRRTRLRRQAEALCDPDRPRTRSGLPRRAHRRLRPRGQATRRRRTANQPAAAEHRDRHRLRRSPGRRELRDRSAGRARRRTAARPRGVLPQRPAGGHDDQGPLPNGPSGSRVAGAPTSPASPSISRTAR